MHSYTNGDDFRKQKVDMNRYPRTVESMHWHEVSSIKKSLKGS